jgi:hypothetical protein
VLDLETTGLSAKSEIIEIAVLDSEGRRPHSQVRTHTGNDARRRDRASARVPPPPSACRAASDALHRLSPTDDSIRFGVGDDLFLIASCCASMASEACDAGFAFGIDGVRDDRAGRRCWQEYLLPVRAMVSGRCR